MDLNGDGAIDILSGSYSRMERDMAGLFQVLKGRDDGTWAKAEVLLGDDGKPLIITPQRKDDADLDRICTRAFAVDLDGDGKLDLVSGNFGGTFAVFAGQGGGKFAAKNTWLERDGVPLEVPMHSDPFFCDWDGDGDQDLLSGSSQGGVFLFRNVGSKTEPRFAERQTLFEVAPLPHGDVKFGEDHIAAPGHGARVWAADVDGDGKLDLLIGDQVTVARPAKGVDEATARKHMAEWDEQSNKLGKDSATKPEQWQAHWEARAKFVEESATGFVWLLRQK